MKQDNLLALEMKKENRPNAGKKSDKYRLIALTKPIDDGVYSADGRAFPEHVCGYILGIYYELDIKTRSLNVEYYHKGLLYKEYKLTF